MQTARVLLRVLLVALPALAVGAERDCDMTKLQPILDGKEMALCRQATGLVIPSLDGMKLESNQEPLRSVDPRVCTDPGCGRAIAAIQAAVGPGECRVAGEAGYKGGGPMMKVPLRAHYLDVIDRACHGKLNTDGTLPEADASAMDPTKKCTTAAIKSSLVQFAHGVDSCVFPLKVEDSDSKAMLTYTCNLCTELKEKLTAAKQKLPTCALPSGMAFDKFLEDAFRVCGAEQDLRDGNKKNPIVQSHLLNASTMCTPTLLRPYLIPLMDLNSSTGLNNCTWNLYDRYFDVITPTAVLTDDQKTRLCESCPEGLAAFEKYTIPKCQLPFDVTYDAWVQDAFSKCSGKLLPEAAKAGSKGSKPSAEELKTQNKIGSGSTSSAPQTPPGGASTSKSSMSSTPHAFPAITTLCLAVVLGLCIH